VIPGHLVPPPELVVLSLLDSFQAFSRPVVAAAYLNCAAGNAVPGSIDA
jgi:hypothetical protein